MKTIDEFICQFPSNEYQLAVANTTRPDPILNLLQNTFEENIDVETEELSEELQTNESDMIFLLDSNQNLVAKSPLSKIEDTILLVNSDLYRTGSIGLEELDVPDVLEQLTNTQFHVSGYPESNKEKLPLIVISRRIEQYAYHYDSGTLRSSFQRLSRLKDEIGTYRVYRNLSETETDVHIYGVPDTLPDLTELDPTIHGGMKDDFKNSWFVTYSNDEISIALAAYELRPNYWNAVWTTNEQKVQQLNEHITQTL